MPAACIRFIQEPGSVDSQGNLYFGAGRKSGKGDIYFAEYKGGRYSQPEKMGSEINASGTNNYAPYIYPDGKTLLFSREQNRGVNIYIRFMQKDGAWTDAKILWENVKLPVLTPDENFLFFCGSRGNSRTCWVDAGFIEELRKKELR